MDFSAISSALPEYARDLRLNLGSVATTDGAPGLTQVQIAGTLLASAIAGRNAQLRDAIAAATSEVLEPAQQRAARAAAAIMGMNNVYYRSTHLIGNETYTGMPTRLRMNVIGNPGVDKVDFELYSLAVSAINGCGACLTAHENVLRNSGLSAAGVQSALRIAAVVNGLAVALESAELEVAAAA